jgi:hypothetical protein
MKDVTDGLSSTILFGESRWECSAQARDTWSKSQRMTGLIHSSQLITIPVSQGGRKANWKDASQMHLRKHKRQGRLVVKSVIIGERNEDSRANTLVS